MRIASITNLVVLLSAVGCGSGGGDVQGIGAGDSAEIVKFVGAWKAVGTDGTLICGDQPAQKVAIVLDATFAAAVNDPNAALVRESGCPIRLAVDGDTATALPGQSCTGSETQELTQTFKYTSYSFITHDGAAGDLAIETQNSASDGTNCTFKGTASLQRQ